MSSQYIDARSCDIEKKDEYKYVQDVYISVFFDGTGNNMYEQINKGKQQDSLRKKSEKIIKAIIPEKECTSVSFSISPSLFSIYNNHKCLNEKNEELENYGMNDYEMQRRQAEEDYSINNERGNVDSTQMEDNGGLKYSNVAILRSLTKKNEKKDDDGKTVGINYNLYIEGSGKCWDTGMSPVGLGMGTGRTGVVGLVSKAVVFIHEYLCSSRCKGLGSSVNLHFAVYGFSRGSTCGRLFSCLVVKNKTVLTRESEFKQYLPQNVDYFKNGRVSFLDEFPNKSVDFLGIYDTVSAIGFLQKDDNSTNNGVAYHYSSYGKDENGKEWYVNRLHGPNINAKDIALSMVPGVGIWGTLKSAAAYGTDALWGDAKNNFHRFNVRDYGLYSPRMKNVKHTFHICAADEFRENFALVDLGKELTSTCTEVFVPGCHSDIGGGIMKDDDIERMTIRTKIAGKDTKMVAGNDPRDFNNTTDRLSPEVLTDLGWLSDKKKQTHIENESKRIDSPITTGIYSAIYSAGYLIGETAGNLFETSKVHLRESAIKQGNTGVTTFVTPDYEEKSDTKFEFERFAKEGYSNITLKMMLERINSEYGLKKVWPDEFIPKRKLPPRFELTEELKKIENEYLKIKINELKEGERYFKMPSVEQYHLLRKDYLHFSCTDELNAEKALDGIGHLKATVANIGNPPNWLLRKKKKEVDMGQYCKTKEEQFYLLCRIIYNGVLGDNELHYMDEYPPDKPADK